MSENLPPADSDLRFGKPTSGVTSPGHTRIPHGSPHTDGESQHVTAGDAALRIDPPHRLSDAANELDADDDSPQTVVFPLRDATPGSRGHAELFLQASQIAENLRRQSEDLDQRQSVIDEQSSLLEQERRSLRLWLHQTEEALLERETRLKSREADFSQKIATCERLVNDLEQQERDLQQERDALATEKRTMRSVLQKELDTDRARLKELQTALEEEQQQLARTLEQHHEEHATRLAEVEDTLQRERAQVEERVLADLADRREAFQSEIAAWTTEQERQRQELDEERQLHQTAFRRAEDELKSKRNVLEGELAALRAAHEHTLNEARDRFQKEQESQRSALSKERILLENRIRFQQDHLQKARRELESELTRFRQDVQSHTLRVTEQFDVMDRRREQLARFRQVLEQREACADREASLLGKSRQSAKLEIQRDRSQLQAEREAWEVEQGAQQAEIRRQQNMLTLHAENLEARHKRLDQLRQELEETHRDILEMRMAVEESFAQLAQANDEETAQKRVTAARDAISAHYRHLQQALADQRQDLGKAVSDFQEQKEIFREERQKLTDWVAERDDNLRMWEQKLGAQAVALDAREGEWRSARDHWTREKREAELIIRDLLKQLPDPTADVPLRTDTSAAEKTSPLDQLADVGLALEETDFIQQVPPIDPEKFGPGAFVDLRD